ncbi:helix-turn-helix transcriptional regulator [Parabacteroides bouchesdurhonensis]|uniref:helix-turn-helix transcriptional regulator n=1 Tax=Parabacteroides bouchesdurhonensis TaxID=1936995 RepID=UPI000C85897F|nr:LuxR family transcriptional regulator [Parabacteroides bouchesdurhonensis]
MIVKTTRLFICIFLAATWLLLSCNKPSSRQVIDDVFKLVYVQPDSAAWLLENKIIPASLTDSDKADYWYLLTLSHLQTRRSTINDSLISYSVQYYKDHNRYDLLYYACRFAHWQARDKKAKENFLQDAVAEAERLGDQTKMSNAYEMQVYYYYGERRYPEVIDACRRWEAVDTVRKADAWYMLGLNYGRMGCEDSSLYYLAQAAEIARHMERPGAGHYLRNYIDELARTNPQKALEIYHLLQQRYPGKYTNTALGIWMGLGQKDSVEYYLSLMENGDMIDKNPWYITRNVMTKARRAYWQAKNGDSFDIRDLAQFVDSTSLAAIELIRDEKERLFMQNKLEQNNQRVESKRQQMLMLLLALLFVFTVAASISIFYIRNRREKLLATEEALDALRQLLWETTIGRKDIKDDQSSIPDSRFFKKVLLQQLGIIRLVATSPTEQNKELLQQMASIANDEIPTESLLVWKDLYPIVDTVYDNFYTRLKVLAAGRLSEKELQLCCLLRAGFSTKEISVVTQQSVRTIYQRKTNIRHALGMNEKDDIVSFIEYSGEASSVVSSFPDNI